MSAATQSLPGIPAATLILLRDQSSGPPLVLMAERSTALAFAGGALVFPGGRTEMADGTLAQMLVPGVDDGAARIAAIRETLEEVGLLPTAEGLPPAVARARLIAGEAFGDILAALGMEIHPGAVDFMVPLAPRPAARPRVRYQLLRRPRAGRRTRG